MMSDFIEVKGQYVKAVKVKKDFFDKNLNTIKLESYFPNSKAREALFTIARGMTASVTERAHIVLGLYGTGKSHFALVLANYVTKRSSAKEFQPLFNRIKERNSSIGDELFRIRDTDRSYLLVLIEGFDNRGLEHALLNGLKEAIEREGLDGKRLKTAYRAAIDKINEWKKSRPDFYERLQESISSKGGLDFSSFIDDLQRFDEKTLLLFEESYLNITTGNFEPVFGGSISDVYEQISNEICDSGKYAGIFVIWDQFSDHLNYVSAERLGKDGSILRDFVETIERPGKNQIHLVLITHRELNEYLRDKGLGRQNLDYWESIAGRFDRLPLTEIEDAEELLSYTITKRTEDSTWKRICELLDNDAKLADMIVELDLFGGKSREWIKGTVLEGCFPLHPIVTYCLPRISEVVALQEYRTMFAFLGSNESGGLLHFIRNNQAITIGNEINFYRLHYLFDFFEDAIKGSPETRIIARNYSSALQKLPVPDDQQTQALLKTICILTVLKKKYPTTPLLRTSEQLSATLNVENTGLKSLLESLCKLDALWLTPKGEYELRGTETIVNIDEDINKAKADYPLDNPLAYLEKEKLPFDLVATDYERAYYVERKLLADYVTPDSLSNLKNYEDEIRTSFEDGHVLYVIAENKSELQTAKKSAITIENPQIVVAVTKNPMEVYDPLRTLNAIKRLKERPPYSRSEDEPYSMLEKKENFEREKLNRSIDTFRDLSAVDFFWSGRTIPVSSAKSPEEISSFVMRQVFPKTPVVHHKRMANMAETDQKEDRVNLDTAILDTSKNEIAYMTKGRNPADMAILEQTLGVLGMTKRRVDGYYTYFEIKEPDDVNAKEVWNLIDKLLRTPTPKLSELIIKLRSPPYGVSPRVIEILLSAFFRMHRPSFTIATKRRAQDEWTIREFTGETIRDIVKSEPDKAKVEYRKDPPHGEKYRKIIYESIPGPKVELAHIDTNDLGRKFVDWYRSIPDAIRNAPEISDATKTFCVRMAEVAPKADASQMGEILYTDLPKFLGIELKFELWKEGDLDVFDKTLGHVIEEITRYPEIMEDKVRQVLVEVFNVKGSTEVQVLSAIGDWFKSIQPKVKQLSSLTLEERAVIKYTNIKADTSIKESFMSALPGELGLGSYEKWAEPESTLKKYQSVLKKTRKMIEERNRILGPKEPPATGGTQQRPTELESRLRDVIRSLSPSEEELRRVLVKLLEEL
jgi:hypothetical protein